MLTDRQNKFLNRMIELNKEDSSAINKERGYLNRSIEAIKSGMKFQTGVNALNLSLRGLQKRKEKPLTPDVDKLSKDLIEVYGEPGYNLGGAKVTGTSSDDAAFSIIN